MNMSCARRYQNIKTFAAPYKVAKIRGEKQIWWVGRLQGNTSRRDRPVSAPQLFSYINTAATNFRPDRPSLRNVFINPRP